MRLSGEAYRKRLREYSDDTIRLISLGMRLDKENYAKARDITTDSELNEEQVAERLRALIDSVHIKIQIIERSKLMRAEWARNFSDTTTEFITQIIERTLKNQGHSKAEEKAKEIRELIESGLEETELLKKIKQAEIDKILSIILDASESYGDEIFERHVAQLMEIVEMSETEEDLLKRLYRIKEEILEDEASWLHTEGDKPIDWLPMEEE